MQINGYQRTKDFQEQLKTQLFLNEVECHQKPSLSEELFDSPITPVTSQFPKQIANSVLTLQAQTPQLYLHIGSIAQMMME